MLRLCDNVSGGGTSAVDRALDNALDKDMETMQVANQTVSRCPRYMIGCYWWVDLLPGFGGREGFITAGVGCI